MGWFDWWKIPERDSILDRVWLNQDAKRHGIVRELGEAVGAPDGPDAIFVVAHFPECLDELRDAIPAELTEDGRVAVTLADALRDPRRMNSPESYRVLILVAEKHPLIGQDDQIVEFARCLGCPFQIVFHVALDDPLLRLMTGKWFDNFMKQLGMHEHESLASPLIARQLRQAHEKLQLRFLNDTSADSAEEWLERNFATP